MSSDTATLRAIIAEALPYLKAMYNGDSVDQSGLVNIILAAKYATELTGDPVQKCEWSGDGEGSYHTSCGQFFMLEEGGPTDNSMAHCCYCGRPLVEVPEELDIEALR